MRGYLTTSTYHYVLKNRTALFWFKTGLDLVENINSKEAFDLLQKDEHAILIDVRTKKEHLAVGMPDL